MHVHTQKKRDNSQATRRRAFSPPLPSSQPPSRRLLTASHPWDYITGKDVRASTDVVKDTADTWCFDCGRLGKVVVGGVVAKAAGTAPRAAMMSDGGEGAPPPAVVVGEALRGGAPAAAPAPAPQP